MKQNNLNYYILGILIFVAVVFGFWNFRAVFFKFSLSVYPPPIVRQTTGVESENISSTPIIKPVAKISTKPTGQTIKIPIITYHYVEHVQDKNDRLRIAMNIAPEILDQQLQSLVSHSYQTYFVRDIPDIIHNPDNYTKNKIVLTFDDGYEDFYTDVFPLLKKYQTKATLYVMYNYMGSSGYMTEDQIKEVADSGLVEIGSHTLDHKSLTGIPRDEVVREVVDNKNLLEQKLQTYIYTFAYPYGHFDEQSAEVVKQAGYTAAVSTNPGTRQSEANIFTLTRLRAGAFVVGDMSEKISSMK